MPLTPNERAIVKALYEVGRPMTISQLVKKTHLNWRSIQGCLEHLQEIEVVFSTERNGKIYWHLNY